MSSHLTVPGPRTGSASDTGAPAVPVLVVDDDDMKRYTLNRLLSPLGYRIVEADCGPAALRCLLVDDFAVILLDIRMPGMDGFETAALIRTRPRSRLTPIMLTTASTRDEIVASGTYGDQVTGFMFAPTGSDDIRAVVSVFGDLFRKEQELADHARAALGSAERWRQLVDDAPVGIFQTDSRHRYTYTNPRWSEITGVQPETALGQDWRSILDTPEASAHLGIRSGPPDDGDDAGLLRIELRVPGAGPKIVVLSSSQILDADGAVAGRVGTLTDVTAVGPDVSDVRGSARPSLG